MALLEALDDFSSEKYRSVHVASHEVVDSVCGCISKIYQRVTLSWPGHTNVVDKHGKIKVLQLLLVDLGESFTVEVL